MTTRTIPEQPAHTHEASSASAFAERTLEMSFASPLISEQVEEDAVSGGICRIAVLRTGQAVQRVHTEYGPFSAMFARGLNAERGEEDRIGVDEIDLTVRRESDALLELDAYAGVIVSGSPAYVDEDTSWMRYTSRLLLHLVKRRIPLLGVCFGHQILAKTFGCRVGPNPRGREMGTVSIQMPHATRSDDPLWHHLGPSFLAQCTHRDIVLQPSSDVKVLASAPHDDHHVIRVTDSAWGVQFHPEFCAGVMSRYLDVRREALDADHGSGTADARLARVQDTPDSTRVLGAFGQLCLSRLGLSRLGVSRRRET